MYQTYQLGYIILYIIKTSGHFLINIFLTH